MVRIEMFSVIVYFFFFSIHHCMALSPSLQDRANLFSEFSKAEARKEIALIKSVLKRDVILETIGVLPNNVNGDNAGIKWAASQRQKAEPDKLLVIISQTPPSILVAIGSELKAKSEFSDADSHVLTGILRTFFEKQMFDRGLYEGLRFIGTTMDNNQQGAPNIYKVVHEKKRRPDDLNEFHLFLGYWAAGLFAIVLIIGVYRSFYSKPIIPEERIAV